MPPKEALVPLDLGFELFLLAFGGLHSIKVPVGIPPDVWGEGSSECEVPCRVWNQPIFVPILSLKKTINFRVWG